ncbi:hypothetical protein BBK36DRAFT_1140643 [Trichoderma citrinoviride]|uniref:Helicase ATP-binding domain-containing protein n=1 Tax=Trichoderma citrinoviride TaxID=58853 RepID=A0A2T4BC34_9HYPO|nr:hypothetical protein BBK36DRAFT_1140643 [Trichoderma citrinoviride]PTB66875.1 hypothetical protein BBK36DRAFT_1140643 [Trichoderma citrinoviride]
MHLGGKDDQAAQVLAPRRFYSSFAIIGTLVKKRRNGSCRVVNALDLDKVRRISARRWQKTLRSNVRLLAAYLGFDTVTQLYIFVDFEECVWGIHQEDWMRAHAVIVFTMTRQLTIEGIVRSCDPTLSLEFQKPYHISIGSEIYGYAASEELAADTVCAALDSITPSIDWSLDIDSERVQSDVTPMKPEQLLNLKKWLNEQVQQEKHGPGKPADNGTLPLSTADSGLDRLQEMQALLGYAPRFNEEDLFDVCRQRGFGVYNMATKTGLRAHHISDGDESNPNVIIMPLAKFGTTVREVELRWHEVFDIWMLCHPRDGIQVTHHRTANSREEFQQRINNWEATRRDETVARVLLLASYESWREFSPVLQSSHPMASQKTEKEKDMEASREPLWNVVALDECQVLQGKTNWYRDMVMHVEREALLLVSAHPFLTLRDIHAYLRVVWNPAWPFGYHFDPDLVILGFSMIRRRTDA